MKPSTTYHMRAKIVSAGSVIWSDQDRIFTTGSLPEPAPTMIVTRTPAPALHATENPGVELLLSAPSLIRMSLKLSSPTATVIRSGITIRRGPLDF
jgi:hypothetical protein